jgi:hypothetical protein
MLTGAYGATVWLTVSSECRLGQSKEDLEAIRIIPTTCGGGPHGILNDMTKTLITGANKGLGFAAAKRLGAEGDDVWLGARDAILGEEAARTLDARSFSSMSQMMRRSKSPRS